MWAFYLRLHMVPLFFSISESIWTQFIKDIGETVIFLAWYQNTNLHWYLYFSLFKCEGAEWIYDTDDDNEPLSQTLPLQNRLLEMKINREKQSTTNIYKQVSHKYNGVTWMICRNRQTTFGLMFYLEGKRWYNLTCSSQRRTCGLEDFLWKICTRWRTIPVAGGRLIFTNFSQK